MCYIQDAEKCNSLTNKNKASLSLVGVGTAGRHYASLAIGTMIPHYAAKVLPGDILTIAQWKKLIYIASQILRVATDCCCLQP